jgi:hypothetical protein
MIHTYMPARWNGLVFLADQRTLDDVQLQAHEGGVPVLERYGMGTGALGAAEWARTARCAMYDNKELKKAVDKATRTERKKLNAERKQALLKWLAEIKPKACLVLQTLSVSAGGDEALSGTFCWDAVGGPGSIAEAQGTAWLKAGCYYVPLPNYQQYDYIARHYIRRWMRMGLSLAQGKMAPLVCPEKVIHPGPRALELIQGYAQQRLISVDIEKIPGTTTVTAMNFSDGKTAVSVPWDAYKVYPEGFQNALESYPLGREIEAAMRALLANPRVTKLGHNMAGFDIIEMRKMGITCLGPVEDSLLKHRMVHPQHRHALQIACATVMCVPPWKTLWHPVNKSKDSVEFWTASAEGLRDYGCDDAYFTFHLDALLERNLG